MTLVKDLASNVLTTRIAATRDELTAAFELVYRWYLSRGLAQPHPAEMVYRETFGLDTTRTLVAVREGGQVVGTLTIVGDNPLGFDLGASYADEVQRLRAGGRRLAEVTALAVEPRSGLPTLGVFFSLTRFMYQYAQWHGYDELVMVVHPRHFPFYRRHFGATALGPCRPYGPACDNPGIGFHIDVAAVQQCLRDELFDWFVRRRLPAGDLCRPGMTAIDRQVFLRQTQRRSEGERTEPSRICRAAA